MNPSTCRFLISIRRVLMLALLGGAAYGLGLLLGGRAHQAVVSHAAHAGLRARHASAEAPAATAPTASVPNGAGLGRSPFLPGGTNVLAVLEAKVRAVNRSAGASDQFELLSPLLMALSTNEHSGAWDQLQNLHATGLRQALEQCLLGLWAGRDPQAAIAVAHEKWQVEDALRAWASRDPRAAQAWARQSVASDQQNGALLAVVRGMARCDPKAAAELLATLPGNGEKWTTAIDVLSQLASVDTQAALKLLDQTGLKDYRDDGFAFIADRYAARSDSEAIAWAQTLSNVGDQEKAFRAIVNRLAATDPAQAVQLLMSRPDDPQRNHLANALAQAWAGTDAQAASAWIRQLPEGTLRQEAAAGLVESWGARDPEAAAEFILGALPAGQGRESLLKTVASRWARDSMALPSALAQAGQLTGSERDSFLAGLCQRLCISDTPQAASLAATLQAGSVQKDAFQHVATMWVLHYDEAPEAGAWAAALPAGSSRADALAAITRCWAIKDSEACAAWLASLPADTSRAQAAEAYVPLACQVRPDLAAQWVDAIADESKRSEQVEEIARRWLKSEPEAARAWLRQTRLPEERKAALLKGNFQQGTE